MDRHCATCLTWDAAGKPTILDGHCPVHDCGFLLDGCDQWVEDPDAHGCRECGVRILKAGLCSQCEAREAS